MLVLVVDPERRKIAIYICSYETCLVVMCMCGFGIFLEMAYPSGV